VKKKRFVNERRIGELTMENLWPVLPRIAAVSAALITAGGFFTLFDEALKSVRKPRLQKEADDLDKSRCVIERSGDTNYNPSVKRQGRVNKYRRVLEAAENPGKYFLSAKIWVCVLRTVAALLPGLIAGSFIESELPIFIPAAVGVASLIIAILFIGELIPGIIARSAPEKVAAAVLPLFEFFTLPLRPFFLLAKKAGAKFRLVFPRRAEMTEDELRFALMEGEKSGIVESKERTMVEGVFYLGDRPLGTFMTHRSEIQWLDINTPPREIREKVLQYREQQCFPVAEGAPDAIVGAAYLEDIILDLASDAPAGLRAVMKKAVFAPETMPAIEAFESFRKGDHLFVMDEYGGFAGTVSIRDLIEEIIGELTASAHGEEPVEQQEDGSWLADGSLHIDDAAQLFSLPGLSAAPDDYHTLAGFILSLAGELPHSGDSFTYQGFRFTVLDMDSHRIGRIRVEKVEEDEK
jgi:putative hemolysin